MFSIIFIAQSVDESFIASYYSRFPLENDTNESIIFTFSESVIYNVSALPNTVLTQLNTSIDDILTISKLKTYVSKYDYYITCLYEFSYNNKSSSAVVYFVPDWTFNILTPFFLRSILYNNTSYNDAIIALFSNYDSGSQILLNNSVVGTNFTILPSSPNYNYSKLLNLTVVNSIIIDEYLLNNYLVSYSPLFYRLCKNFIDTHLDICNFAFMLPLSSFYSIFTFYKNSYAPNSYIKIQFYYNFTTVSTSSYQELTSIAYQLSEISGYSSDLLFKVQGSNELLVFMEGLKLNLKQQWWLLFALSFPLLIFMLYVVWLSFGSFKKDLTTIFNISALNGFPNKKLLINISFFYFASLSISLIIGLTLSFFLVQGLLTFINNIPLSNVKLIFVIRFNFNLISLIFSFFCLMFSLSIIFILLLYRHVKRNISQLIAHTTFTLKARISQYNRILIAIGGITSISLLVYITTIHDFLSSYIEKKSILELITLASYYIAFVIITFFVIFLTIPFIISIILNFCQRFSIKLLPSFFVVTRNMVNSFPHFRRRMIFTLLSFFLVFQALIVPLHVIQKAVDTAKLSLGADMSLKSNNETIITQVLAELSSFPDVIAYGNYTLLQVEISYTNYYILAISPEAIDSIFYSSQYSLGYTRSQLETLQNPENIVMVNQNAFDLLSTIHQLNNRQAIYLLFNNITAFPKTSYIVKECYLVGLFEYFPIVLKTGNKDSNLIISSSNLLRELLPYKKFIKLEFLEYGIIIRTENARNINEIKYALISKYKTTSVKTWREVFPYYLPSFSASIFSLLLFSLIFGVIFFVSISYYQMREYMITQQRTTIILRLRGFSKKAIFLFYFLESITILATSLLISIVLGRLFVPVSLELAGDTPSPLPNITYSSIINNSIIFLFMLLAITLNIISFVSFFHIKKEKKIIGVV